MGFGLAEPFYTVGPMNVNVARMRIDEKHPTINESRPPVVTLFQSIQPKNPRCDQVLSAKSRRRLKVITNRLTPPEDRPDRLTGSNLLRNPMQSRWGSKRAFDTARRCPARRAAVNAKNRTSTKVKQPLSGERTVDRVDCDRD